MGYATRFDDRKGFYFTKAQFTRIIPAKCSTCGLTILATACQWQKIEANLPKRCIPCLEKEPSPVSEPGRKINFREFL